MYWFADDAYLGGTNRGTSLSWRPTRSGTFEISVVDDHGRATMRTVVVEFLP
jgi:penicillin-binding protein 1C